MRDESAIGVVTFPVSFTGNYFSLDLVRVIASFASKVILVTGEVGYRHAKRVPKVVAIQVVHTRGRTTSARLVRYGITQMKMALAVVEHSRGLRVWIFHNGGDGLAVALLAARLLRRRPVLILTGSPGRISAAAGDPLSGITFALSHLGLSLAKTIVVYSNAIIAEEHLGAWTRKVVIAHEHFVDLKDFTVRKGMAARGNHVGYIGRLSPEKGILGFLEAVSRIARSREDISFSIAGVGPLEREVRGFIESAHMESNIRLLGLVPHEQMPAHLNELSLLVIPSSTEGLPTILAEAFATGTPVLATPVGSIPDFVKDGKTGFILETNSPDTIAKKIVEVLSRHDLDTIAENARRLALREFSYGSAVARFSEILLRNHREARTHEG